MNAKTLQFIIKSEVTEASATQKILKKRYRDNDIDKNTWLTRHAEEAARITTAQRIWRNFNLGHPLSDKC